MLLKVLHDKLISSGCVQGYPSHLHVFGVIHLIWMCSGLSVLQALQGPPSFVLLNTIPLHALIMITIFTSRLVDILLFLFSWMVQ